MGFNDLSAIIYKPGMELNLNAKVTCECGYTRHCGYMIVTANSLADRHSEIGESHNVTVHTWDAPPLTRSVMTSRARKTARKRQNRATIETQAAPSDLL